MRKLLIFLLVLGLASTASAVSVAIDANLTATVYLSDETTEWDGSDITTSTDLVIIVDSDFTVGYWTAGAYIVSGLDYGSVAGRGPTAGSPADYTGSHYDAAGDLAKVRYYTDGSTYDGFELLADNSAEAPAQAAGDWFVFDYHCDGIGDVVISFYDYATSATVAAGSITITQIPEPATIALLGLGGLLLLRRRK